MASIPFIGLGLVYVGKLGAAIVSVLAVYGIVALLSWTRLIVTTPYGVWVALGAMLLIIAATAIGATVVAVRSPQAALHPYNRWFCYLLWILMTMGFSLGAYRFRERAFGYAAYIDPSPAMSPTIEKGEYFIVDTWRYLGRPPEIGEIIVFELADGTAVRYLKRIVGLPGDLIEIRNRILYRNGQPVAEPYTRFLEDRRYGGRDVGPTRVEEGRVFVLGDNRDNSKDSRHWGTIPISQLRGRAQFLVFSYSAGRVTWSRIGNRLSADN